MPVKVCLLIDSLGPNSGNEILLARMANALDPAVIETHVACYEDSERLRSLNPWVRRATFPLSKINSAGGLKQLWRFHRYLKENRIDAVHSFVNNTAIFGVLAALGGGCRTVITSRLNTGYWFTRKKILIFQVLNRFTTHILTNSAAARKITAEVEKVSADKITVFYPGVDLARYAASAGNPAAADRLGIPKDAPVVGIVANLRPVKNLALFLRAAALVAAAAPDAAFLIVGQGPLKDELRKLAAELGISGRVFFSSPEGDVPDYLARMSIACLSSNSEGLPNAIMEYMAAALPVVTTEVGGVPELVRDGFNGYLVRDPKPESFAGPIIRLLRDPELRKSMGQRGLERARQEFDGAEAVRRLERFYLGAVKSAGGKR